MYFIKSDWGIGITGYATPEPSSGNKVFAFYAIAYKNKIKAKGKLIPHEADPTDIQLFYANQIMNKLLKLA